MKFDIGDVNHYDGEDLIFVVGAPGSRWTQIAQMCLVFNSKTNNTDWSQERSSSFDCLNHNNDLSQLATHYGSFWGPGNYYGQDFDRLDQLTKETIVDEFMQAYSHWDGIKIIKSHWFAYHLERLEFLFPKATFICAYQSDFECLHWWNRCGGWAINYGGYSWYENDTRMMQKIKEENYNILKFNIDRDVPFQNLRGKELVQQLSFLYDEKDMLDSQVLRDHMQSMIKPKISIYNKHQMQHYPNFKFCKLSKFSLKTSGLLDKVYEGIGEQTNEI
jgi:hypothetical protein